MFQHRFRHVHEGAPSKGHVFRVVDAHKEIIAFTEIGPEPQGERPYSEGFTWRGSPSEFKRQFTMVKPGQG